MRATAFGALLLCVTASAQPLTDPAFSAIRTDYEFGKFQAVVDAAEARIESEKKKSAPSEPLMVELHKYAGVAAFNLGKTAAAETHFFAVLQLSPDYELDPFVYPPPAVAYFEKLRRSSAKILDSIREARKEQALRKKREEEEHAERERKQRETEEQRRKSEDRVNGAVVRVVERQSFLVNFVPFGAGQFQQGRNGTGALFAGIQGALALTSIASYWLIEGMRVPRDVNGVTIWGIESNRVEERDRIKLVRNLSGVGFYLAYTIGVGEAIVHHQFDPAVPTARTAPAPSGLVEARPLVFPTPGGIGAGLSLSF